MVEQRGKPRPLVPTWYPCNSLNSLIQRWVCGGVACAMFSLVDRLPSMPSAGACRCSATSRVLYDLRLPSDVHVGLRAQDLLQSARLIFPDGRRGGLPVLARGV